MGVMNARIYVIAQLACHARCAFAGIEAIGTKGASSSRVTSGFDRAVLRTHVLA